VSPAEKAHDVAGAIDDDREQVRDLAAKDTHVEGGRVGGGKKTALERYQGSVLTPHFDGSVHDYGSRLATHSGNWAYPADGLHVQCPQYVCAEDSSIRACINKKGSLESRPVSGSHLSQDHRTKHPIVT